MSPRPPLHFNLFIHDVGHHEAAWRLPESDPRGDIDLGHYVRLAQTAEAARFDSLFLADGPSIFGAPGRRPDGRLEPTLLLTALATATSRIGLIATASTTYNSPYNLARRFGSLDHISNGRAGWNIVTTAGDASARNFGLAGQPHHIDRYQRAAEFVDVVRKLWDSWDDDAVIADKASGVHALPDLIREVAHEGEHFQVAGPLNLPRSPQGHPLLVQAGSSENGRNFAARHADAVFTAQPTTAEAKAFYADLKSRARAVGRDPEAVKILPGIVPVIGSTEAEARARAAELESLIVHEHALTQLAGTLNVPLESLELDKPLPFHLLPGEDAVQGAKSRYTLVVDWARRDGLTVRQLLGRLGGGRGHRTFVGTPEQVADTIRDWADNGAADGFNIMPAVLPSHLDLFVEHVAPILRSRGLLRSEYEGTTLREHYGLPRPSNTLARARGAVAGTKTVPAVS